MLNLDQLQLERFPVSGPSNLRAWDAADEYLLKHLEEESRSPEKIKVLVVNDSFGALSVALAQAGATVHMWSDSFISQMAVEANLEKNGLLANSVHFVPADRDVQVIPDLVVLKIPKSLAWWQDSLLRLRKSLTPDTPIIAGSMIKHTPRRAYTLMEECLGPVKTSLGWKKSRLAVAAFDPGLEGPAGVEMATIEVPAFKLCLQQQANVFSRTKLDHGTRFLLEHLPAISSKAKVLDLGCGAGVLALAVKRQSPESQVLGIDESYQAISSARSNAVLNNLDVDFLVGCDLSEVVPESLDVVLCNPPFHQDRIVGDGAARSMFGQAQSALKKGGEMRVVANSHLGYHARLTEMFGGCRLVASNEKFVVLSAQTRIKTP